MLAEVGSLGFGFWFLFADEKPFLGAAFLAAALILCAIGVIFRPHVADIILAVLLVFFAMRLSKTRKFMPNGLMLVLTVATLALRHLQI